MRAIHPDGATRRSLAFRVCSRPNATSSALLSSEAHSRISDFQDRAAERPRPFRPYIPHLTGAQGRFVPFAVIRRPPGPLRTGRLGRRDELPETGPWGGGRLVPRLCENAAPSFLPAIPLRCGPPSRIFQAAVADASGGRLRCSRRRLRFHTPCPHCRRLMVVRATSGRTFRTAPPWVGVTVLPAGAGLQQRSL